MALTESSMEFMDIVFTTDVYGTTGSTPSAWLNVSPYVYKQFKSIGNSILTPMICLLGLAGNIVSICVLQRDPNNKRQSVYLYLISLMAFDNAFLGFGFLFSISDKIEDIDPTFGNNFRIFAAAFRGYIFFILKHMTAVLLIVMSAERWSSLVFPFTVKRTWLSKYPRSIVGICFVINVVYLIPFARFEILSVQEPVNKTELNGSMPPIPASTGFFDTYVFIETLILYYAAPLVILLLNISIVVVYRRVVTNKPEELKKHSKGDNQKRITLVVLGVAFLYILLTLPNVFIHTLIFIDPSYNIQGKYETTFMFFIDLGDILAQIYAATDFFVYILVSKRYRKVFTSMVRRPTVSSRQTSSISRNSSTRKSTVFATKCSMKGSTRTTSTENTEIAVASTTSDN